MASRGERGGAAWILYVMGAAAMSAIACAADQGTSNAGSETDCPPGDPECHCTPGEVHKCVVCPRTAECPSSGRWNLGLECECAGDASPMLDSALDAAACTGRCISEGQTCADEHGCASSRCIAGQWTYTAGCPELTAFTASVCAPGQCAAPPPSTCAMAYPLALCCSAPSDAGVCPDVGSDADAGDAANDGAPE